MTEPITTERLKERVAKLEYEKPRIVQWGHYDEERLVAYRELLALRARVVAKDDALEWAESFIESEAMARRNEFPAGNLMIENAEEVLKAIRAALAPEEPGPSGTSEG